MYIFDALMVAYMSLRWLYMSECRLKLKLGGTTSCTPIVAQMGKKKLGMVSLLPLYTQDFLNASHCFLRLTE